MIPQAFEAVLDALVSFGAAVVRASWQASVLAVLVLAAHYALRRRVAARWLYLMWGLVLLRLALPAVPASPVSVFNLLARWTETTKVVAQVTTATTRTDVTYVVETSSAAKPPLAAAEPAAVARARSAAVAPSSSLSSSLRLTWKHWLALAWVFGIILLALRVAWASIRVGRFVRGMGRADDANADALLRTCAASLGVRRVPELRCDARVQSPALVGWIRPKLLLPQAVVDDFDPTELRMIFLHELAHQKRRDVLVNWLATVLQVVHWFNPVVWLVMWRVRTDREVACDELVLSLTRGADRRAYGRTILKLLETLPDGRIRGALAPAAIAGTGVGILEGKHQMKRRITMIAQFGNTTRRWTAVAAVLAVALVGVALTDAVQAQAPAPETAAAAPVTAPGDAAIKALEKYDAARELLAKKSLTMEELDAGLAEVRQEILDKEVVKLPTGQIANQVDVQRAVELAQGQLRAALQQRVLADAAAQPAASGEPEGESAETAQARMSRRVPELKFDAIPFSDVIDFLRDVTNANLFVNWRALEAAGIDRQAPVTARMRDVPFGDALDIILKDLGGGTVALGHTIQGGVIVISTEEELESKTVIKVYEVADLLTPAKPPATQPTVEQKGDQLKQLIQDMIAPDSWRDAGGTVGGISIFDTRLVVIQTPKNHDRVQAFLQQLRAAAPASPGAH